MSQAYHLHLPGDYLQAEAVYNTVLQHARDHAEVLFLLGVLAQQHGDSEAAQQYVQKQGEVKQAKSIFFN